jgi:hypothetical protein
MNARLELAADVNTPGNVFVFNLQAEDVTVSANGAVVGTIPGWDTSAGYAPNQITVGRVGLNGPSTGKLAEGTNTVKFAWLSVISTSGTFTVPDYEDNVLLSDDLVCFVTVQLAWLMDVHGFVLEQNQLYPKEQLD